MFKWNAGKTMVGLALGGLLLTGTPAAAEGPYDSNIDQRNVTNSNVSSGAFNPAP